MVLTPLDIQNKEFRTVFRGYSQDEVNLFLSRVLKDYEQVYKENQELKEEIKKLSSELDHYHKMEETLNRTLVMAQEASEELKKNTVKECELMKKENELQIQKALKEAQAKIEAMQEEYEKLVEEAGNFKIRLKSELRAYLEMLEGKKFSCSEFLAPADGEAHEEHQEQESA